MQANYLCIQTIAQRRAYPNITLGGSPMIANEIAFGKSFAENITYNVFGKAAEPNPHKREWYVARNLFTDDLDAAGKIMQATASNSKAEAPVYHFSIDWDRSEERFLTQENTGKAWDMWKSKEKLERATHEVAKEMEFLQVPGKHNELDYQPEHDQEANISREQRPDPLKPWSKEGIGELKEQIGQQFYEALDWQDLTERLDKEGYELQQKGQGLIITDGTNYTQLSKMGKQVRLPTLEQKFGEKFENKWQRQEAERHMRKLEVRVQKQQKSLDKARQRHGYHKTKAWELLLTVNKALPEDKLIKAAGKLEDLIKDVKGNKTKTPKTKKLLSLLKDRRARLMTAKRKRQKAAKRSEKLETQIYYRMQKLNAAHKELENRKSLLSTTKAQLAAKKLAHGRNKQTQQQLQNRHIALLASIPKEMLLNANLLRSEKTRLLVDWYNARDLQKSKQPEKELNRKGNERDPFSD